MILRGSLVLVVWAFAVGFGGFEGKSIENRADAEEGVDLLPYFVQVDELGLIQKQHASLHESLRQNVARDSRQEISLDAVSLIESDEDIGECIVCREKTLLVCSQCNRTHYCSQEHQHMDWEYHKVACPHHLEILLDSAVEKEVDEISQIINSKTDLSLQEVVQARDWASFFEFFSIDTKHMSPPIFRVLTQRYSQSATILHVLREKEWNDKSSPKVSQLPERKFLIHVIGAAQWEFGSFSAGTYDWLTQAFPHLSFEFRFIGISLPKDNSLNTIQRSNRLVGIFTNSEYTDYLKKSVQNGHVSLPDVLLSFHPGVVMYPEWRNVIRIIQKLQIEFTFTSYREWEQSAEVRVLEAFGFQQTMQSAINPFRSFRPKQSKSIYNDIFYENTMLVSVTPKKESIFKDRKMPTKYARV